MLVAAILPSWHPTYDRISPLFVSFSLGSLRSTECRQPDLGWAASLRGVWSLSTTACITPQLAASILQGMALLTNEPGEEDYAVPRESETHQPSAGCPTGLPAGALRGYKLSVRRLPNRAGCITTSNHMNLDKSTRLFSTNKYKTAPNPKEISQICLHIRISTSNNTRSTKSAANIPRLVGVEKYPIPPLPFQVPTMTSSVSFKLEDAIRDLKTGFMLYRIRVPAPGTPTPKSHAGPQIRYLAASADPAPADPFPDIRGHLLAFDTVPSSAWTLGRLSVAPANHVAAGKFLLASTERTRLEGALGLFSGGPAWHDRTVDLVDLLDAFYARRAREPPRPNPPTDIQCVGHLFALVVPSPNHAHDPAAEDVVASWAWPPGHAHAVAAESRVHAALAALSGPLLAPRFLAHITDNAGARVIGALVERVDGGRVREAGPGDLAGCRAALGRLHALGFAYGGSLRRESFLVREDGGVLMQGFGGAWETEDGEVLAGEMDGLEEVLKGPSRMV